MGQRQSDSWGEFMPTFSEVARDALNIAFEGLKKDLAPRADYCDLRDASFDDQTSIDYSNPRVQNLYLLRYLPAYLAEYTALYSMILHHNYISNPIRVLSIGCGCGLDCMGLMLCKDPATGRYLWEDPSRVIYHGVDITRWALGERFVDETFKIFLEDAGSWTPPAGALYNVVIFPKSLSDIPYPSFLSFRKTLLSAGILQKKFVFAVSYGRVARAAWEKLKFVGVVSKCRETGFCPLLGDDPAMIEQSDDPTLLLNDLYPDFSYPPDIRDYLLNLSSACPAGNGSQITRLKQCDTCKDALDRNPMSNLRYLGLNVVRMCRGG